MPWFDPHNGWHLTVAVAAIFYFLTLLGFSWGLTRLKPPRATEQPSVSVVVAARNEERHLERLLTGLLAQDYPDYEVVIVNDRSTDGSAEILRRFQQKDARLKVVEVEASSDDLLAKQNALSLGIAASRGEILCLTDADCLVGPRWVARTVACFSPRVGVVAGYSPFSSVFLPAGRNLFQRMFDAFVRYEEYRKAVRAAAVAAFSKAWACTGRNLAFRRAAFEQVGGYRGIPRSVSGDDTLLLQQIGKRTDWDFCYLLDPEHTVPTAPPQDLREFQKQRVRHSRGIQHFPRDMRLSMFLLLMANLLLVAALAVALFSPASRALGLAAFGVKGVADTILFLTAAPRFREWSFAPTFLLLEAACSVYYFFLFFLTVSKRRVEWKQ